MSDSYNAINAWREILARTFADTPNQDNISPPWLINPATRRRLKLDKLYPDLGVAVRFAGLLAKGQGRQSDWEVMETEQRDDTREALCRQNGVELVKIDAEGEEPIKTLEALGRAISRAGRRIEQSDLPYTEKAERMTRIGAAREMANDLRRLIARTPDQMMANLAAAWRDRETSFTIAAPSPPPDPTAAPEVTLRKGQRIQHERLGTGVVTALTPETNGDTRVSILFDSSGEREATERTFLLSLLAGKVTPR